MSDLKTIEPVDGGTHTLWSSIGEALRGSHQDYTAGNLNRWRWCWSRFLPLWMSSG